MKTLFVLFLLFLLFLMVNSWAQINTIIPKPIKVHECGTGEFLISEKIPILYDAPLELSANFFKQYVAEKYQLSLPVKMVGSKKNLKSSIHLSLKSDAPEGHYLLMIDKNGVQITGSESGVFYGVQSLIQLLPTSEPTKKRELLVPYMNIADAPRFVYRGLMLDVSRHFFPVEFVKKCIDIAAYHKMNYFHLHLTDDQGWRIEIKKYPKLNGIGSWRNGTMIGQWPGTGNDSIRHGGFYTQGQIRDLVAYAQKRYITIVPEIEMPGHSLAALAAYPNLGCTGGPYQVKESWGITDDVYCAGNDSVFTFLQGIIDEVIDIFPSKYIHIGGDECRKDRWKACPKCQKRIKTEHLKDEHELQSYFVTRMEKYINSKGRTIIGWDEILEGGIAPNAVVMSWRGDGTQGLEGALRAKHPVIFTPSYGFYLDYPQTSHEDSLAANWGGVTSVKKSYLIEPITDSVKSEDLRLILGAQTNIWTEYMSNPAKVEYMMLPRLSAISEVLWSPKESRNWDDFKNRMEFQYQRYQWWGYAYNPVPADNE